MRLYIIALILLPAFFVVSVAEDYEFKVLAVSGKVSCDRSGWSRLKTADKIYKTDQISLGEESYVGLLHKSGNTIEITKAGRYTVKKLASDANRRKGIENRLAEYVAGELSDADDMLSERDHQQDMKLVGATERASAGETDGVKQLESMTGQDNTVSSALEGGANFLLRSDKYLSVSLPRTSYLAREKAEFSWYPHPDVGEYMVLIKNTSDSIIAKVKTQQTKIDIDIKQYGISREQNYWWLVKSGALESGEHCIRWISGEEADKILNEDLARLGSRYSAGPGPLELLMAAITLEDRNLMLLADAYYRDAIERSFEAESFMKIYCKYLKRIGLRREARRIAGRYSGK
jgi:hypothetical protein